MGTGEGNPRNSQERGFVLIERAPGATVEEIKEKTAGRLVVEGNVPEMKF